MENYVIVGGGLAGLVCARILADKKIPFVGVEKTDRLGGRAEVGHHRLYARNTLRFLQKLSPETVWEEIDEPVRERRKGEWVETAVEVSEEEAFYLGKNFIFPKLDLTGLVSHVGKAFKTRKTVVEVDAMSKTVTCQDGTEIPYEKLIWCSPLGSLLKVWKGEKARLIKQLKDLKEGIGGINLDLELNKEVFPFRNTMIMPFRYKERKLRALGLVSAKTTVHWMLFLEREIIEDREELAKCIRTFKRELQKEFPDLKDAVQSERIVYLPSISGEHPALVRSLDILPDVIYVGPQAQLENREDGLRNIDLTLNNCQLFEELVAKI